MFGKDSRFPIVRHICNADGVENPAIVGAKRTDTAKHFVAEADEIRIGRAQTRFFQ
jgi:hypothetical protein